MEIRRSKDQVTHYSLVPNSLGERSGGWLSPDAASVEAIVRALGDLIMLWLELERGAEAV